MSGIILLKAISDRLDEKDGIWFNVSVVSKRIQKMDYIKRPYYVQQLERWKDCDLIKVVTGVRRCGKSTVLEMYRGKLREAGIVEAQMVALNFEDPDTPEFPTWRDVWNYIRPRINKKGRTYVFLDKIWPELPSRAPPLCLRNPFRSLLFWLCRLRDHLLWEFLEEIPST